MFHVCFYTGCRGFKHTSEIDLTEHVFICFVFCVGWKTCVICLFMCIFWEMLTSVGNMLGTCWDMFGTCWKLLGNVWDTVGKHLGNVGNVVGTIWKDFWSKHEIMFLTVK